MVPVFPGSQIFKMVGVPVFPGSQMFNMAGVPESPRGGQEVTLGRRYRFLTFSQTPQPDGPLKGTGGYIYIEREIERERYRER